MESLLRVGAVPQSGSWTQEGNDENPVSKGLKLH